MSILPNIFKVYERSLDDQISIYFKTRFSKFQWGFRKGYGAQHCLLAIIKKSKTALDNACVFAALLTDLSKAFGCIPHDLIIAKVAAHGFDNNSLKLAHNYLSDRKQRVKVNSAYSAWKYIFHGVHLNLCFSIYTYVKQKLKKQAYPSFSLYYFSVQAMFKI